MALHSSAEDADGGAASPLPTPTATPSTPPVDRELNFVDLELMHNFTTSVYLTLSTDPLVRQMWRVSVVGLALRCDYVMRTLLSISALHLAHQQPGRKEALVAKALSYHRIASRQAMGLMSGLDEENAEKLFLFSLLTIFFGKSSSLSMSSWPLLVAHTRQPDQGHLGPSWAPVLIRFPCPRRFAKLRHGTNGLRSPRVRALPQIIRRDMGICLPRLDVSSLGDVVAHQTPHFEVVRRCAESHHHLRDGTLPRGAQGPPHAHPEALETLRELIGNDCDDGDLSRIYDSAIDELRYPLSLATREGAGGMDIMDMFIWK
ncbi:hypothetical protein CTRI78_v003574 [Colletotrichum trifolii]|uniref:Uncharacterized protein n=1 Tax=Colletotrichum trifolii TaxID=5466 RepID=A0A4R8RJR0_COLTR|nr:hypothetical protein CTRI78_v003574 [Colletotrichum trifolii]